MTEGTTTTSATAVGGAMTTIEIMSVLPHRYPFLLVDRVLELVEGERILAMKNIT
ncbi:hypothetical protein OAI13_00840, partial [Porticoccaceae bacterium]|nr:hypothetical protein [Porticoccaceae bacterium]